MTAKQKVIDYLSLEGFSTTDNKVWEKFLKDQTKISYKFMSKKLVRTEICKTPSDGWSKTEYSYLDFVKKHIEI